jgi:hypothetical protein
MKKAVLAIILAASAAQEPAFAAEPPTPASSVPAAKPNIDRLAQEGRRFTGAHSASAVCAPSRYALLTGRALTLTVTRMLAKLSQPWDRPYRTDLRVVGLPAGKYTVVIHREPPVELTAVELGNRPLLVLPDGKLRLE